ncbi:putative flagellar capping protein [Planococcus sp. PAMC 21323]|uniref:flagellar filament capping protein FliD n=1 Tax=Planococcus sp. PAMC 21323 TaxID=1526927 RepID=UPI00056E041A|nr:flagellar filament capping protein FliD [Planococcus sp. PAMC 21323]AIY04075.1 putative flagellar capping protein [Planococcus sp. PAMC 21323]
MRVGGLASGMDTESIVKDMMKIQKLPLDKLMQEKTFTGWQQEAIRETNLSMSSLRTSASSLRLQSSFNAYSAVSPNPTSFTVATTPTAMSGSYKVEVVRVASAAKLTSTNAVQNSAGTAAKSTDQIGTAGKITIASEGRNIVVDVNSTDTFADIAKNIQDQTAASIPALRASFDNTTSRFFIATKGMGSEQAFRMDFTAEDGTTANADLANKIINNGTATATADGATDGAIKFDGIEVNGLKTNQTTVNGLTINLLQAGTVETINVQSNPEKPLAMIKEFVDKYNETIDTLQKQIIEKRYPDFQPLSDEQKKELTETEIELWEEKARSGLLRNDPIMKSALQDLRRAFMDTVSGVADGNLNHLSQIGINTGSYTEGGKLFIDEEKLKDALTKKPEEVMALFTTRDAAGDGVGARVYDTLNSIVTKLSAKAGSSSSSVDNSTLSQKLKRMDTEISRWQDRLSRVEDRYWKQFTAMEKALSKMNSQSTWMQQSLFGGS